jgi:hypothetical protein
VTLASAWIRQANYQLLTKKSIPSTFDRKTIPSASHVKMDEKVVFSVFLPKVSLFS